MSLGALTIVEKTQGQGPIFVLRCQIQGDGAYAQGGSTGLLAKLRAALGTAGFNILAVIGQSSPAAPAEVEYDHANDKLYARARAGGEFTTADQSATAYGFIVLGC